MNEDPAWQNFIKICMNISSKKLFKEFLELCVTSQEKAALGKRIEIIKALILEEIPQRQMAQELEVSISKITRGSNTLKNISAPLRKFLKDTFDSSG